MLKSIKFRIYPDSIQIEQLENQFGCSRFIYNWALDYSNWEYKNNKTRTFKKDWKILLPKLKEWLPWLKTTNSQSLQEELIHLEIAYKRFFKKQGNYPNFKSKYDNQSFSVPQHFKLENGLLSIPKIKNIKIIVSKQIGGILRSITISKTKTNKYFASVLYDTGLDAPILPVPDKDKALGIDLGIKHFMILDTGYKINNPKFLERTSKKLRLLSKSLSRKQKSSKNRYKAKMKLALYHEIISNKRNDFIHKITNSIVCKKQEINTICVENLNVKNMLKNRKLAKSISSVSWGETLRQLKYKCLWFGMNLLQCDAFDPTSRLCNNCKYKNNDLLLSDRYWTCNNCNTKHDRDINASKNIKDFAFKKLYPRDNGNFKSVEMKALVEVNNIVNETIIYETEKYIAKYIIHSRIGH